MKNIYPKVGLGLMIMKDGKVLMGKRKGSHGAGMYALTGGSLEFMESFEGCAKRETFEECGIEIKNIKFCCLANEILKQDGKHYADVIFTAEWESGEPTVIEPNKCESWDWYDLNNLPQPLYPMTALAIKAFKTGENFFDMK